jgi:hypothetical protein
MAGFKPDILKFEMKVTEIGSSKFFSSKYHTCYIEEIETYRDLLYIPTLEALYVLTALPNGRIRRIVSAPTFSPAYSVLASKFY